MNNAPFSFIIPEKQGVVHNLFTHAFVVPKNSSAEVKNSVRTADVKSTVCYILETADILSGILGEYDFDFLTGSVHWIDGWGFDHMGQKELWKNKNINEIYKRYYNIMFQLCESSLFTGLAHPDSIKCFGYIPDIDLTDYYNELAVLLNKNGMYTENSGGLRLNYCSDLELGLNPQLLSILKKNNVKIETASDAHKQSDVGANILELENMLKE